MAGSLRLKRGSDIWELRVYAGRDSLGKVKHVQRTFQGTKREANRELARLVFYYESQKLISEKDEVLKWSESTTINDAISGWRDNGWDDLSPTTVKHYQELWDRYIIKAIGRRQIATLSPYDVEKYFRSLKKEGVGHTTIRHIRGMLHRACRLACKWSNGRLYNPISDSELPAIKLEDRGEPVRAPEASEVRALLEAASAYDARIALFIRVIAASGIRRGEACALRWSDIDYKSKTIKVDEAIVAGEGSTLVKGPKTRASERTIALDDATLNYLSDSFWQQKLLAKSCGVKMSPDGFVFSTQPGGATPPHPDSLSHAFSRVRKASGVASDIHLHSLRHFQATALDSVISEAQKQARLGWSSIRMARHYTDSVPNEDRRAAEHVGRLLDSGVIQSDTG